MGRFTGPDPLHILKQKLLDAQQWNMYAYARNNPLRFLDPTGMYVASCNDDVKNCQEQIQNFENAQSGDSTLCDVDFVRSPYSSGELRV